MNELGLSFDNDYLIKCASCIKAQIKMRINKIIKYCNRILE